MSQNLSKVIIFVLFLVLPSLSQAQKANIKPSGINGSVGAGFINWTVLDPDAANVRFDQGQFVALAGERGFGVLNLYLNLSLSYLTGTGQANYYYETVSGEAYSATDANFKADLFQAGLGLKMKIIDGYWFRPYVEAGGTGGYFQLDYTDLTRKVTSSPTAGQTNYKKKDSLLDFGRYLEGGLEIDFSGSFGLRAGARFLESRTKKFATLDNKELKYKAEIYYFSLLMAF